MTVDFAERPEVVHSEAQRLLRFGRYAEAWPLYEARRAIPGVSVWNPITEAPEWRGEDVSGKRVVVCAEQGWGDQIMFGRFLAPLQALGAEIVVVCHPKVARLFEHLGYWTKPYFSDRPIPPTDYWVHIGTLPHRLGDISPPDPVYLKFELTGGGGIGVITSGNPQAKNNIARSLPPPEAADLLKIGRDLRPEATGVYDFFQTAEIIAGLDLVISVCTSVAHLAASMGVETWVLLARPAEWRWGEGERSDWYPDARLFRQPVEGDWVSVIQAVQAEASTKTM